MLVCLPLPAMKSPHVFDPGEWPAVELATIGWTERGDGGTTSDGSYLITADTASKRGRSIVVTQGGSNEWRACHWTAIGATNNSELYAIIKLDALPDSVGGGGLTWTDSFGTGFDAVFDSDGSPDEVHVSQLTGGSFNEVVVDQDVTLNTSNRFHLKYSKSGETLSIKCWKDGDPEPSYTSASDSTNLNSFKAVGIQTVRQKQFRVDFFSVGQGTHTAPGLAG